MTVLDQVRALIERLSPEPVCDDCITERLALSVRQHANIKTRELKGRRVGIERVGRSYDRTVARVRLDGRDVAALLVEKGAARWWPRGKPRPNWCKR
ncbi:hypothetical protein [Sphingomonas sp. VNH70]|uniref:thermonuclease family protein n=1 Tax=Sphingomonas silueang TaxID=3156617 RepID=UPI0032B515CF